MFDYSSLTDGELWEHEQALTAEKERRAVVKELPLKIEAQIATYQDVMNIGTGEEWSPPTAIYEAYIPRSVVKHDGKMWRSRIVGNTSEPGVGEDWEEVPVEYGGLPEWTPGTMYEIGDRVTYNDNVYQAGKIEKALAGRTPDNEAMSQVWKKL